MLPHATLPAFLSCLHDPWVEATLQQLSLREQIAQLLHVAAYSNRDEAHVQETLHKVEAHGIGGLTFFQGDPLSQLKLTRRYQAAARVPLLISMDAEWGLGMRLDQAMSFPYQMTLGAMQDESRIEAMGREIARQCQRLGVHLNFAPVVDVNNNPDNPVIGFRAFGDEVGNVATKARAYARGLQAGHVLTSAKHFPGHGDTEVDSHLALPTISHARQRLEAVELAPFKALIEDGVAGVMVAHLSVPALDPKPGRAATLSPSMVGQLLKEQLHFQGLVITDALDMKGVTEAGTAAELGVQAFLAGNDLLLNVTDLPATIDAIEQAVEAGLSSPEVLAARCRKLLAAKRWAQAQRVPEAPGDALLQELAPASAQELRKQLHRQSLTLLHGSQLPRLAQQNVAAVAVYVHTQAEHLPEALRQHALTKGSEPSTDSTSDLPLHHHLKQGLSLSTYALRADAPQAELEALCERLKHVDHLLLSVHGIALKAHQQFGVTPALIRTVNRLLALENALLITFASPYVLPYFDLNPSQEVILAYQENALSQQLVAEALIHGHAWQGRLPVKLGKK